jgi:UDP-glucose 4-epimerase
MLTTVSRVDATAQRTGQVVVIGAAGFIGSRLTTELNRARVVTAALTRTSGFLTPQGLSSQLRGARIIYYLASSINPGLGEQYPELAAADHELFATLLERLSRTEYRPTVVLTSSGGCVYDQSYPAPYAETSPIRAVGRYGAAKRALEQELWRYAGRIPSVILRVANAYGPGQSTNKGQGVLAHWLRAVVENRPLRLVGDIDATRDYVYIDDLVDCMYRLNVAEQAGKLPVRDEPLIINVGSGVPTSLADLLDVVRRVVDRDLEVEYVPGRALDRRHVWLDVARARQVLDWQPRTTLDCGVGQMWRAVCMTVPRLGAIAN